MTNHRLKISRKTLCFQSIYPLCYTHLELFVISSVKRQFSLMCFVSPIETYRQVKVVSTQN